MTLGILFTLCIAFVFPIAFLIYLVVAKKNYKMYLLGFATFFIFQLLLRIPLLNFISSKFPLFSNHIVSYALYLGLGAGLFEELGRLIMMKIGMKDYTFKNAVIFGIGHFSCEAIMLVGINYLIMLLVGQIPPVAPHLFFVAGLERLFVLPVHVAMSIMVMNTLKYKRPSHIVSAIVIHTAIDSLSVILQSYGASLLYIEGFVFLAGLICFLYIRRESESDTNETI